jgi:iron complex outermembrane receptor protein
LEVSYSVTENVTLSLGATNLFDEYPSELAFNGQTKDHTPNNSWGGKYYETSPFGFNGGFYYFKANYQF